MKTGAARTKRVQTAQETMKIVEAGEYVNSKDEVVDIREELAYAIRHSILFRPDDPVELSTAGMEGKTSRASIEVTGESSLDAARRLILDKGRSDVICLNFASAKNPGGGFLNGAQAQEESLARASGLYPCIVQMEEMYTYNRGLKTCLYSDYMILSPRVPVIRDGEDRLLDQPYVLSFLTAPAVNAGVVREREPQNEPRIGSVMLERIRRILRAAARSGHGAVILGAYGCGVFRNRAVDVAEYFAQVLMDEGYDRLFDHIVFAVLDHSARQENLRAIQERFA